jgi:hypothetical protein
MGPGGAPQLILIDTSSLLPLIYCGHGRLVRSIKARYALQFGIVQAVKSESQNKLTPPSKFAGRQEALRKAVENNTLVVVDGTYLKSRFGTVGESLFRRCDEEGERLFYLGLDRGEAYTYGASLVLNCPVVNNDTTALRRLRREQTDVPTPHLRFWDVILLGLQSGLLVQKDCEDTRTSLLKLKERLPACFTGNSVGAGMSGFYCRLIDPTKPTIGADSIQAAFDEFGRLEVRPVG